MSHFTASLPHIESKIHNYFGLLHFIYHVDFSEKYLCFQFLDLKIQDSAN